MNVFLIGLSQGGVDGAEAERALEAATVAMAPFALPHRTRWSSSDGQVLVACAAHAPQQVGGVEYLYGEPGRMALFAGRPFRWTGESDADGQSTLDPRSFLPPAAAWADTLDGRCAVVRYDASDGAVEVYADPIGTYALFTAVDGGTRWVSNSVEVLRHAARATRMRHSVLASMVGAAHSVSGEPLWEGIDRLTRGLLFRFRPDGSTQTDELLTSRHLIGMLGSGFDADRAAATLAAAVAAAARWPGRPDVVPTTAGKDSRLIFEAALLHGVPFESETVVYPEDDGYPMTEDAAFGRELCRRAGISHRTVELDLGRPALANVPNGPALVQRLSSGAVSFNDVRTIDLSLIGRPVRVIHKGMGGEIARTYYGVGRSQDADGLTKQLVDRMLRKWPRPLLSAHGRGLFEADVRAWTESRLAEGVQPADAPDLFYIDNRVGGWAGGSVAVHDVVEDTALPLCSRRVVPHMLGMPIEDRERQRFHTDVLAALQRLRGTAPPAAPASSANARRLAVPKPLVPVERWGRKGVKELSARAPWSNRIRNAQLDPFIPLFHQTRARVAAQPDHEAWAVLERERVDALLRRDPRRLEPRSRVLVARLATALAV